MSHFWARTLHGIEDIAAAEITTAFGGRITGTAHRDVLFEAEDPAALIGITTIDDLYVHCGTVPDVGTTKDALGPLADGVTGLPLTDALDVVRTVRDLPAEPGAEVVCSFLGRRTYSRYDVEDTVGAALRWPYLSRSEGRRPDGDVVVRVHIVDGDARVGIRIAAQPLRRRAWLTETVPGSLHPPLAAALVLLAEPAPGAVLCDPCCGAGTIPIEALTLEPRVRALGVDIDPVALRAARQNAAAVPLRLARADAGRLPVRTGSVDRVCSNLPWGQTVEPAGALAQGPGPLWDELARVLAPGGRVVLLMDGIDPAGAEAAGFVVLHTRRVAVSGTWATITVLGRIERGRV